MGRNLRRFLKIANSPKRRAQKAQKPQMERKVFWAPMEWKMKGVKNNKGEKNLVLYWEPPWGTLRVGNLKSVG